MPRVSLIRRVGAVFVDWVASILVATLITGDSYSEVNPFVTLTVFVAYSTIGVGLLGFTIGKRIFGLRVEGPSGQPIGVPKALARQALLCLVVPAFVQNEEGRGVHDVLAVSRQVSTR